MGFLQYPFMVRALLAAILSGATCSAIGALVVLKGAAFIGVGISQAGFAGVAFALLVGIHPMLGALLGTMLMVVLLKTLGERAQISDDTTVGVLFSASMALAVLFVGLMGYYPSDLMSFLFGNILAVTVDSLRIMAGVAILVFMLLFLFYRQIQFTIFDGESAFLSGIPTSHLETGLLVATAAAIVISLQAVGQALVLALLVIPASIAYQVTKTFKSMLITASCLGVFASVTGMVLSFYLDVPSGATIVLVLSLMFFVVTVCAPRRIATWVKKRKAARSSKGVGLPEKP